MSENLDLVRSIYADWERGDFSRTDWADSRLEVVFADGPTPGATRLAGMAKRWREVREAWNDVRERASGVDLARTGITGTNVFHVRNGSVTRRIVYFSGRRALGDLGLEE